MTVWNLKGQTSAETWTEKGATPAESQGTLNATIAYLGSIETPVIVSAPMTLTANLTVPSNIQLISVKGGSISGGYSIVLSGQLNLWGGQTIAVKNVVVDSNTTIIGNGKTTIIKTNDLSSDYVVGYRGGTAKSKLVIKDLVIDGNKTLGTFTGAGHGLDILNFDEVYIDNVEVKNAYQHGVRIQDCNKVHIGTLITHDNNKYGVTFETTILAEELSIGKIISYSNGWTGVAFGDTTDSIGWKQITIGEIISHHNGTGTASGEDGVAFGRNATGGNTGAQKIVFGSILAYNNADHGVEFFGSRYVTGGSIQAFSNSLHGVAVTSGDDGNTHPQDIQIDSILAGLNGRHGTYIEGARKLSIGRVAALNNSQGSSGTYSGLSMYGSNDVTKLGNIHIDSVLAYDDQGSPTQKYGYEMQTGAALGNIRIDHLRAYGNITRDAWFSTAITVDVGKMVTGTWGPRYSDAGGPTAQLLLENHRIGSGQTTDATPTNIISISLPGDSINIIEAVISGKTADEVTLAGYIVRATVKRAASGFSTLQGTPAASYSEETDAGLDGTVYVNGSDGKVYVRVTGLAATTIDWQAKVKVDTLPF